MISGWVLGNGRIDSPQPQTPPLASAARRENYHCQAREWTEKKEQMHFLLGDEEDPFQGLMLETRNLIASGDLDHASHVLPAVGALMCLLH